MKVEVTTPCIDKNTGEYYRVGRVLDVTEERAAEMREFVKVLEKKRKAKK